MASSPSDSPSEYADDGNRKPVFTIFSLLLISAVVSRALVMRSARSRDKAGGEGMGRGRKEDDRTNKGSPANTTERSSASGSPGASSKEFSVFQQRYFMCYLAASAADWLKGPYIYSLYHSYGYSGQQIVLLFATGYLSGAVVGTFIGSAADRFGRRTLCSFYGFAQLTSVCLVMSPSYGFLVGGRIASGVASSTLSVAFEAWMVSEHHRLGFDGKDLSQTFASATFLNSCTAVGAGIVGQAVAASRLGPRGPFMLSGAISITCVLLCRHLMAPRGSRAGSLPPAAAVSPTAVPGGRRPSLLQATAMAGREVGSSASLRSLLAMQTLFESSMYMFVLVWTPALQQCSSSSSKALSSLPHGLVFACYMLACMVGANGFSILVVAKCDGSRARDSKVLGEFLVGVFVVALLALGGAGWREDFTWRLGCFMVYEMCVGAYFPSVGRLRSLLLPEGKRAAMSSVLKMPLNLVVVSTMLVARDSPPESLLALCTALLAVGTAVAAAAKPLEETKEE